MSESSFSLKKIDLATKDPRRSAEFYTNVFQIEFKETSISGSDHFSGEIGEIELYLCPRHQAGTGQDADGVHQFHIETTLNIQQMINEAKDLNCETDGFTDEASTTQCCIWDPDGNPWIISNPQST